MLKHHPSQRDFFGYEETCHVRVDGPNREQEFGVTGKALQPSVECMTQPQPLSLTLADAYLYGAWIEDIQVDAWDVLIRLRYSDRLTEFYELEARLNLRSCTLAFLSVRNSPAVETFRQRWDASDDAWSIASVASDEAGGYVLATREAGELAVDCTSCELRDIEPFEADPRFATPRTTVQNAEAIGRLVDWQQHQFVAGYYTQGRIPPYLLGKRPNKFGYALLLQGFVGLGLTVALFVPSFFSPYRAPEIPQFIFWSAAEIAAIVAGYWLLQPPSRHR